MYISVKVSTCVSTLIVAKWTACPETLQLMHVFAHSMRRSGEVNFEVAEQIPQRRLTRPELAVYVDKPYARRGRNPSIS